MRLSLCQRSDLGRERLERLHAKSENWAFESGLHGLPDHFRAYAEAEIAAVALEKFGWDRLEPVKQREGRAHQRLEHLDAIDRGSQWAHAATACAAEIAARSSSRRQAWSVATLFGIWGLSDPEMSVRTWGLLILVAALAIVNLRALGPAVRFAASTPRMALKSLDQVRKQLSARYELARSRSLRSREERRREDRERWSATELQALLALHDHNRDLAVRASAA